MSLISELLEKPASLSTASKYTAMNGYIYLSSGAMFIFWPGAVQTLFRDAAFRWQRRGALSCDGYDGCSHRLALLVRRSVRWATSRRCVCARSMGARSRGARAARYRWRLSSYVPGICASRRLARHRRLDAPQPHRLIALRPAVHAPAVGRSVFSSDRRSDARGGIRTPDSESKAPSIPRWSCKEPPRLSRTRS